MADGRAILGSESERSHERSVDSVIAAVAARQHGRVARRQLLAARIRSDVIARRVASGHLIVEYPGVYAVGHRSAGWPGRWMAAVLAAGNDSALSFAAGAAHLGVLRWRPTAIDITCPRALRDRPPLRFHRSVLPADEIEVVEGIPTTTVARTLLDLASVLTPAKLAVAINEAEVQGLTSPSSLPCLLERHPRRPGVAAIREILASEAIGHGGTDSELEDRYQALVVKENLQQPQTKVPIELPEPIGSVVVDNL